MKIFRKKFRERNSEFDIEFDKWKRRNGLNLIFSSTRLIWMKELDNEQFKLYIYKIFRKMFRERNSEFDVKFDKWNYVQSIE